MQIVLARIDEGQVIEKHGRVDLGERHKFKRIQVPVAVMWLNHGSETDAAKARVYGSGEGYTVFCYTDERNPLARARRDVMAAA